MKVFLMYGDRDFDLQQTLPANEEELTQDLELNVLYEAMADGDEFLRDVAKKAILTGLRTPEEILYRQEVLSDCMANAEAVRKMYGLAGDAIIREKRIWGWLTSRYPAEMLHRSNEVLQLFSEVLAQLRHLADTWGPSFQSEGLRRFCAMLSAELNDAYLKMVADHLQRLAFRGGVTMTAKLGAGNKGADYILRKPPDKQEGWLDRLREWATRLTRSSESGYVYEVVDRDEAGFNALSELKAQGIASVAPALAQSADHILSFFRILRLELGFYVGCLNLHDHLSRKGERACTPQPFQADDAVFNGQCLYDPCLSLSVEGRAVGNDIAADHKALVILTGANRGGKSTLLRAAGIAQLMMQCGMFVAADSFSASLCAGLFTHFKREEDAGMLSGKLDEELKRMSSIVGHMTEHSMMLFNESFASTNEREGSEIARQIVRALREARIRVLCVTHMFDLAHGFYAENRQDTLFLRAERLTDGQRTFRLIEGEPLPTSYGEDLYRHIFEQVPDTTTSALSRDEAMPMR